MEASRTADGVEALLEEVQADFKARWPTNPPLVLGRYFAKAERIDSAITTQAQQIAALEDSVKSWKERAALEARRHLEHGEVWMKREGFIREILRRLHEEPTTPDDIAALARSALGEDK